MVFRTLNFPFVTRLIIMTGVASLLMLSSCAYQLPPQPTALISTHEPDSLPEILKQKNLPEGAVAVLGGQILKRHDTPEGRFFLVRNLPLDENSFPQPPAKNTLPDPDQEFILFTPALHVIGEHRPKQHHRMQSAFVVFGKGQNHTNTMVPGHVITAVGEIGSMTAFPGKKDPHRYLLIVSHYVMLWFKARPEDYPLVPDFP